MKSWKSAIQAGAWSILVLLLIPPLWYSLNTPFALIDDYGNFDILGWFSSIPAFMKWCHDTWFVPEIRFRITFDVYQALTWALFGENSTLHHAMRWVLKAVVVWSTFKILRLMAPSVRSSIQLSFWVFCAIYIFFPNNPEARLAPQEMLIVTFLALLLYEISRLLVRHRGDLGALSIQRYLWLVFVFTAMLWSKEPDIIMGAITCGVLISLNQQRWKQWLPLVGILLVTGFHIWIENKTAGYGKAPVTWDLIYQNIVFHGKSLFWAKVLTVATLLTGAGVLLFQTGKKMLKENVGLRGIIPWLRENPALMFYWLICLNALAFSATFLTMWHLVLRYFYPLVYLLSLWIALSLLLIESFSYRRRTIVTGLALFVSIYFIGANYYNFVYQFADQYYTRLVEQDALKGVDQLLKEGKTVTLTPDEEYEVDMEHYFNINLSYYKHTSYQIHENLIGQSVKGYYVTRESTDFLAGEYDLDRLVKDLSLRGVDLSPSPGIDFINAKILTNKELYKKYTDVPLTQDDQDFIKRIKSYNDNAIKRFNRSLIDRGDASISTNDFIRNKSLLPLSHQWYRRFDESHVSKVLWWSDRFSSLFYGGHPALYWRDGGADWIGRHAEEVPVWYIYHFQ